jgi:hypothetical protein
LTFPICALHDGFVLFNCFNSFKNAWASSVHAPAFHFRGKRFVKLV